MVVVTGVLLNTNCAGRIDDIKPRRRDGAICPVFAALQVMYGMNTGPSGFLDWSTRRCLSRCCRHFAMDNLKGKP